MTQISCHAAYDCPAFMLGGLAPPPPPDGEDTPSPYLTSAIVHGVDLPPRVVSELRKLGIALSWYSPSELEDAVHACAVDGTLVDDEHGVGFADRLHLSDAEKRADTGDADGDRFRHRRRHMLRTAEPTDLERL